MFGFARFHRSAVAALGLGLLALVPAADSDAPPVSGTTYVALTFDDAFASQADAVPILEKHKMLATFYVSTDTVGGERYLTWEQIDAIEKAGHEIGGHTMAHPMLSELSTEQAKAEICGGRSVLRMRGYAVKSFAYPYGDADPPLPSLVESCGFTNARDVSGLKQPDACTDCPVANKLPLEEPFRIRANSAITNDSVLLRSYVTQASTMPGEALVPLVFHHVCDPCDGPPTDERITPAALDAFLTWLGRQPVEVVTTQQAIIGRSAAKETPAATGHVGAPTSAPSSRALAVAVIGGGILVGALCALLALYFRRQH